MMSRLCGLVSGILLAGAVVASAQVPCSDGNSCTRGDTCESGVCVPGDPLQCTDDGNPCTNELCDPQDGCVSIPTSCVDGDPCTLDDCDPEVGCINPPMAPGSSCDPGISDCLTGTCQGDTVLVCVPVPGNEGGECDDGNPCTENDTCTAGACTGTAVPDGRSCADPTQEATGECAFCSAGICDLFSRNGNECDDGTACTENDQCMTGVCLGTPIDCSDDDDCTDDLCVGDGNCINPPTNCSDGNPCTSDDCVAGACVNAPANEGRSCDDNNPCTASDQCGSGICGGTPLVAGPGAPVLGFSWLALLAVCLGLLAGRGLRRRR